MSSDAATSDVFTRWLAFTVNQSSIASDQSKATQAMGCFCLQLIFRFSFLEDFSNKVLREKILRSLKFQIFSNKLRMGTDGSFVEPSFG